MASPNDTNVTELPSFTALKGYERRAVFLRYEGKSLGAISNHINDEFILTYSERTIGEWFQPGGRLEQGYHELLELMAKQSLREARMAIKHASKKAADTLVKKMDSTDERVAVRASMAILNKFIPDKQVVLDAVETEDDLPEALADIADKIAKGEINGSDPVDDADQGEASDTPPGETGDQTVS